MKGPVAVAANSTISADIKYYNANTRDAYVGDCVKRALSVAYSMDYDKVSAELNAIKRKRGNRAFNETPVFTEFIKRRGDSFYSCSDGVVDPDTGEILETRDGEIVRRVLEFCDVVKDGVYLVLVSKNQGGYSTHLAAIVDGTLYDSWDSQKWFINQICKCKNARHDVFELNYDMVKPDVDEFLVAYVETLNSKCPDYMTLSYSTADRSRIDRYTYEEYLSCKLDSVSNYADRWKYRSGRTLGHFLTFKLNPRMSVEENIETLKRKAKQKIYDWVYNIRKDLQDAEAAESLDVNPKFRGDRVDLMKLPSWCRPYVTYFYDTGEYDAKAGDVYRFVVYMDALPEDPRYESDPEVSFYADTLRELKSKMNDYLIQLRLLIRGGRA